MSLAVVLEAIESFDVWITTDRGAEMICHTLSPNDIIACGGLLLGLSILPLLLLQLWLCLADLLALLLGLFPGLLDLSPLLLPFFTTALSGLLLGLKPYLGSEPSILYTVGAEG